MNQFVAPIALAAVLLATPTLCVQVLRSEAALPDPTCSTGVLSLAEAGKPQACCAGYCGECSDYPTCGSVRGQDSKAACCKSTLIEMKCGGDTPANKCLKTCDKSVPPCVMPEGEVYTTPDPDERTAADDCGKAKKKWKKMRDNASKAKKKKL